MNTLPTQDSAQQNQAAQTAPQQPSAAMQIQQLLLQQQQLQQQYNQIVTFLQQNPNQEPGKTAEIKAKLDQLNSAFLQGKQQLDALGYKQVQVNKPTEVKQGAKNNFSFKKLAIGCGVFFVILTIALWAGIYFLIQNPNALNGVGVTAATAKTLISVFTGLFFGVIILLWLGVTLSNIYRLITVKNQSKTKYILALLGGILLLWVGGGLMGFVFSKVSQIETAPVISSTAIVAPYWVGKGDNEIYYQGQIPLIAPSEFSYSLQTEALLSYATKNLGQVTIQQVNLICGNKQNQTLSYNNQTGKFMGRCLYDQKGSYQVSLSIDYFNELNNERTSTTLGVGTLDFLSEIVITTASAQNTKQNTRIVASGAEFFLGKAPAKISVDTSNIFRDFGLKTYQVLWDMDGDNSYDRENQTSFLYTYKTPKVYYPTVKFPELSDFVYQFPIRVEQSDVPICDITFGHFEKSRYKIQTDFLDGSEASISAYSYSIIDTTTSKTLETLRQNNKDLNYTFPERGNYAVVLDFVTIDWKRGQCESEILQLQQEIIDVQYSIYQRPPGGTGFILIPPTEYLDNRVVLTKIPQAINIDIDSISPSSSTTQKNVFVDGKAILNEGSIYSFTIADNRLYEVLIKVEDLQRDLFTEIRLEFVVQRPEVVGELLVEPAIGYEPLQVTLDASRTTLNVEGDEIIYFTWDFGDGEIKKNLTNAVIVHVYKYDYTTENREYQPTVTITTKKWYTVTVLGEKVLVKKQLVQLDLSSPSHPTQIARVGDTIALLAEFNGLPNAMVWDFNDGSTPQRCSGRNCTEMSKIFTEAGIYSVKLSLEFDDMQTVDSFIEFRIN